MALATAMLIGALAHSALYGGSWRHYPKMLFEDCHPGIYLVFFTGALYVEYTRRLRGLKVNMFLFVVTVVLFLLITATWAIQILRTTGAFVNGDFYNYYATSVEAPRNMADIVLHVCQVIVADSAMLYRLYIVWGRSRRVVLLPLVLTIVLIVVGFCQVIPGVIGKLGYFGLNASFLGVTLVLNIITSGLISYRIWSITRRVTRLTCGHKTYSIVYILLENAALYVGCIGSSLIGVILDEAYPFIILDTTGPVIGIAFCLIIVWVGLGMDIESTSQAFSDVKFHHSTGIPERSSTCL
ncbi:hypothetical protein BD779DRAFT_433731 [Infundibulicybe gibba]|nr:hypothetical protein BD779DRAFT_433731 [Infundibulicybe gibba]